MNASSHLLKWAGVLLAFLILPVFLLGCVGVVGDGYVGGDVYVPTPDVYVFGGFDHHFDGAASHRGFASRSAVGHLAPAPHPPAGHVGGGGHR